MGFIEIKGELFCAFDCGMSSLCFCLQDMHAYRSACRCSYFDCCGLVYWVFGTHFHLCHEFLWYNLECVLHLGLQKYHITMVFEVKVLEIKSKECHQFFFLGSN